MELRGWEVASLRAGRAQIADSYVVLRGHEAYLLGAIFSPPPHADSREQLEPDRSRRLLLSRAQLDSLAGALQRKGYTCICTELYWKGHLAKCKIALGKSKQLHDRRQEEKRRQMQRESEEAITRSQKSRR